MVAIAIGLWVLPRTWTLLSQSLNILLEGVPGGVDIAAIRTAISGVKHMAEVHDLHIWSLSGGDLNLTVHVVAADDRDTDDLTEEILALLATSHHIDHVTVQVEQTGQGCDPATSHL